MRAILFLGLFSLAGITPANAEMQTQVPDCYEWRNGADVLGAYNIQFPVWMNPYQMHEVLDFLKFVGLSAVSVDYYEQTAKVYPLYGYGKSIRDRNHQLAVMSALQLFLEKGSIQNLFCVGLVDIKPRIGVGNSPQ